MTHIKDALKCLCLCAAILALYEVATLAATTRDAVAEIPVQLAFASRELMARVDGIATDIRELRTSADKQLTGLRGDLKPVLAQTTKTLASLQTTADSVPPLVAEVRTQVGDIGKHVTPVLDNSAALVKDAQDSLDDIYPDVRGFVESATVAATGVAVSAEAVGKAAPEATRQVTGIITEVHGIGVDVHKATTKFTAPQPWWKRFGGTMLLVVRGVAALL